MSTNAARGAIFVNTGATLNISSSNFSLNNNSATVGGTIDSAGGNVTIQRARFGPVSSVSIASNKATSGGAIFAFGGTLSIDGMQFLGNSAGDNGGAVSVSGIVSPNAAAITRTYFQDNSAGTYGASIYSTRTSTANLSGDTFYRNNGGVYVDTLGTLNVINSTFLGSTNAPEGIDIASGIGNVTFSTILLADLSGPMSGFNLSNSLLRAIDCTNVTDLGNNLSNQSPTCSPIPNEADLGLSPQFLQNNGGPTPTIALVADSPAIGAIKIGDCVDLSGNPLMIDQRGFGRPSPTNPGFCDTGAFEFGAVPVGAGSGGIPPGTTF